MAYVVGTCQPFGPFAFYHALLWPIGVFPSLTSRPPKEIEKSRPPALEQVLRASLVVLGDRKHQTPTAKHYGKDETKLTKDWYGDDYEFLHVHLGRTVVNICNTVLLLDFFW